MKKKILILVYPGDETDFPESMQLLLERVYGFKAVWRQLKYTTKPRNLPKADVVLLYGRCYDILSDLLNELARETPFLILYTVTKPPIKGKKVVFLQAPAETYEIIRRILRLI